MALAESLQTWPWLLPLLGLVLLTGRLSPAYGVSQSPATYSFRVFGMAATLNVIGAAAVACLLGSLQFNFGN
jgi:uncharacterized membrane protein YecN with MAPEG domain